MKGRGKKHLHVTPAEFARAAEARDFRWWQDHKELCERKNKRDSERIMPAHPKPKCQSVGHKFGTSGGCRKELAGLLPVANVVAVLFGFFIRGCFKSAGKNWKKRAFSEILGRDG